MDHLRATLRFLVRSKALGSVKDATTGQAAVIGHLQAYVVCYPLGC